MFSVLLAITFSFPLIRYLGLAARGGMPADAVMMLLALLGAFAPVGAALGHACSCRCCSP